jgi:hypothetical protein
MEKFIVKAVVYGMISMVTILLVILCVILEITGDKASSVVILLSWILLLYGFFKSTKL